jgi:hypothetical protein
MTASATVVADTMESAAGSLRFAAALLRHKSSGERYRPAGEVWNLAGSVGRKPLQDFQAPPYKVSADGKAENDFQ